MWEFAWFGKPSQMLQIDRLMPDDIPQCPKMPK
jgi:hypothetical protein